MELGFIGIGRMGSRMAKRLLAAGHKVTVFDINADACRPLAADGAAIAKSPEGAARSSEIIITSVPGPAEVGAVIEGPKGILAGARPGTLIVETSTIGPAQSCAFAEHCAAAGLQYIDAPVSNGLEAADAGTLTIMVGGEPSAYERALPVLRHLGTRIYHLGPIGSGNVAKIANQLVYLSYVASFCEVAGLGYRYGLDMSKLVDVLRHSVAGAPLVTGWERRIETGEIAAGFQIYRVLKDLSLGTELCADKRFDAPVFEAALQTFRKAAEAGFGENDMSAIYSAFLQK